MKRLCFQERDARCKISPSRRRAEYSHVFQRPSCGELSQVCDNSSWELEELLAVEVCRPYCVHVFVGSCCVSKGLLRLQVNKMIESGLRVGLTSNAES